MSEGNRDTYNEFIENTKKYKNFIVPIRKTSLEASKEFKLNIDFLFIDGYHLI